MKRLLMAVALAAVSAGMAWAQLPSGAIRGLVADPQAAVVPGATVTATHQATGLVRSTVTNASGEFRIGALPSGSYEVGVELQGFQKQVGRVELQLNQEAELNFTLRLAGAAEEVMVVGTSPIIETTKSEVSRTFREEQIRNLPLPGRNYLNLMLQAPGAVTGGQGAAGFGVTVNGQRPRQVNFIIDGSDNNDASVNGNRTDVIQDAVGEFRLVTSLFSAEMGRNTGAVAIASTKSGTNQLRGTAFEFYENGEKLNARTNLEKAANFGEPGKLRRDTYGFSLGGPVLRDRLFFFGAVQRREFEGRGAAVPVASPTPAGRALLAAFPGADPQMVAVMNTYLPEPNDFARLRNVAIGPAGSQTLIPVADYIATLPNSRDNRQAIIRVDNTLSGSDNVYARYIYGKTEAIGASNPPGFANDTVFPTHNLVGTWNRVLSSALLNEFHFSYGRTGGLFPLGSTNPEANNELPRLNVQGLFNLGVAVNIPQDRKEQVWQFTDAVSYLRGNHSFKFGADLRRLKLTSFVPFDFRGTYTYPSLETFIVNRPNDVLKAYGDPGPRFDYWENAAYVQDDWKVTPDLTLNLGLRYERVGAAQAFYSNVANDNDNFGPRAGFAWDITGAGTTVIRGGYGLAYDQVFLNIPLLTFQSPPFQRRITDFAMRYPQVPADRPITDAERLTLNLLDIPDDAEFPEAHQWQIGVQRQLGEVWRAEAAYIGSLGRKLIRQRVGNPVLCCPRQTIVGPTGVNSLLRHGDPMRTGQHTFLEMASKSEFHSGQFSLERRFRNGFSVNAAYTWSRFMDDASESLGTGTPTLQRPQNNFDFDAEWSPSAWDRPHRLVVGWVWQIPVMEDQSGVFGRVLGGWNIAGSYAAQSGQPFTVITGVDSNGDGDAANDRPDVGQGDRRTKEGYTQRGQFIGGDGTLGRNSERGPGINRWDAVLFKNVRLVRSHEIQFRAEVFNVLNHRQYNLRNDGAERNLTTSTAQTFYNFGTTNGLNREADGPAWGSRSVVLGLKYLF